MHVSVRRLGLLLATALTATFLATAPAQAATVTATITVGSNPYGIAVSGTTAYVTNIGSNTVSVIDTATNTVTGTIPVGSGPTGVTVSGTTAYVTNSGSGTVSVIDTATNQVTATIPVGSYPYGVAVSGTTAYVTNFNSGTVSVINTTTNTVTATIPVGTNPYGVAVSGTTAYVTNNNALGIAVINTTTNQVATRIPLGGSPVGIAVSSTTGYAYVATEGSNTVSVINTTTDQVVTTIPVGNYPQGIAVSGATAYVTNDGDNTVSVIDTATNTVTATIPVGVSPEGVAVSTTTGDVYVTNYGSNTVSVIAPSPTTTTVTSTPNPATAGQPVTLTATVSSADGTPTGTVTFLDNGTAIGTGVLNSSGIATFSTTALAAGTHTITATYAGNTQLAASTGTVTITVNAVTAAVTPNPIAFGKVDINTTATKAASVTLDPGYDSMKIGTQTGPFHVTAGTCTASSCPLTVTYKPTATQADSGTTVLSECTSTGTCRLLTNNPLAESGTGVSAFGVSPSTLDLGDAPLFTNSAPGSQTFTIDAGYTFTPAFSFVSATPGFYSESGGNATNCTGTVGSPTAVTTCTISVVMMASEPGPQSLVQQGQECEIADPSSCRPLPAPFTQTMNGTSALSVTPATLDFGVIHEGSSSTQQLTVTPDSGFSITSVTSDNPAVTTNLACPVAFQTTSAPCTIPVTATPTSPGPFSGTITVKECVDPLSTSCITKKVPFSGVTASQVTFNLGGAPGTPPAAQWVTDNGTSLATPPNNPSWTGYTFDGWYTATMGGSPFDFSAPITAPVTIYAQWTRVTVSPATVHQGGQITVTGTGYQPGEQVTAVLHSTPLTLGTFTANNQGTVTFTATVPTAFATGAHTMVLTGAISGRRASAALTVIAGVATVVNYPTQAATGYSSPAPTPAPANRSENATPVLAVLDPRRHLLDEDED